MNLAVMARDTLAVPQLFDLYQKMVGAPGCLDRFATEHVRPRAGERLLDIGCGTGAMVRHLPDTIELVGIDVSEAYIRAAQQRYGDRATFRVADAADRTLDLGAPFDTAFAAGVLHHIDDAAAVRLVAGALDRLRPGGRFLSFDPTLVEGQGRVSSFIVRADRGQHVRTPQRLAELLAQFSPRMEVVHDMMRIPFAQVIMTIDKRG